MSEFEWLSTNSTAWMLDQLRGNLGDGDQSFPVSITQRQERLYACGMIRQLPPVYLLGHKILLQAIEVSEWYADGGSGDKRDCPWFPDAVMTDIGYLQIANRLASEFDTVEPVNHSLAVYASRDRCEGPTGLRDGIWAIGKNLHSICISRDYWEEYGWSGDFPGEVGTIVRPINKRFQADILRDIIGNPFCKKELLFAPVCNCGQFTTIDFAFKSCGKCGWEYTCPWLCWNNGQVEKIAKDIYREHNFEDMPILGDALEDAGCSDEDILGHCRNSGVHIRGCWLLDLLLR